MSPTPTASSSPTEEPEVLKQDHLRRIEETVQQLRDEGADLPEVDLGLPPKRGRSRLWIGLLSLVVVAELAGMAVVSRLEDHPPAVPVPLTPCEQALETIETALTSFHTAESRLPGTLAALVPTYLPAIPKPGAAPIEYETQGEGYFLRCAPG